MLEAQKANGVKTPLAVIQDVVTRWWSTYSMCERLITIKLYIQLLLNKNPQIPHLSETHWTIIEALVKVLEPFMHIQKVLEGQKYVNISLIPFLLSKARTYLDTTIAKYYAPDASQSILELLQKMRRDFIDRWGSGEPNTVFSEHKNFGKRQRRVGLPLLTMQAAALDPRTKAGLGLGSSQDQDEIWKSIHTSILQDESCSDHPVAAAAIATSIPGKYI